MKCDIVKFGYSNEVAVDQNFDLNLLRRMKQVKDVRGTYVPREDSDIEVKLSQKIVLDEPEIEKINIDDLQRNSDQYREWWLNEQKKSEKVSKELECLKLELAQFRKESSDETNS